MHSARRTIAANPTMKILYLGVATGTSGHRMNALRRLGHHVEVLNPFALLPRVPMTGPWTRYLGSVGLASWIRKRVLAQLAGRQGFDVVWVDNGLLVSRELVEDLKRIGPKVLNYNVDDPYGTRDLNSWHQYRRAVRAYDLVVVVRQENVEEAKSLGARKVLRVYRSADEVAHAPFPLSEEERARWASDVLFAGTGFPERGPFLAKLIAYGIPLTIWGADYHKSRYWKTLRSHWKGDTLLEGNSYALAIQAAKVNLGMLSRGNRDLHTTRSLEIPSLGAVLCAERTEEHLALYDEDREAVFWSTAEECAAKCRALLADDDWRQSIAENARHRYLKNGWTNMNVAEKILHAVFE
jgi:spore maturation protein CgeB